MRTFVLFILLGVTASAAPRLSDKPTHIDPAEIVEGFEFWLGNRKVSIQHYNGTNYRVMLLPDNPDFVKFYRWMKKTEIVEELLSNPRNNRIR